MQYVRFLREFSYNNMDQTDTDSLAFNVIDNNGDHGRLEKLIRLKNIFRKQLPKMPGEYIVRLVLDKKHKCMIVSRNNSIIGGVCFRFFEGQIFSEIAFLAITYSEQVKGYGTILMNQLKNYVREYNIRYFLTYADNFALGYFKKQGFSTEVDSILPEYIWKGYIKDYDGGTLMVCKLDPDVDYTRISASISLQHTYVKNLIDQISTYQIVRDPCNSLVEKETCTPDEVEGLSLVSYDYREDVTFDEEAKDAKTECFNFIIQQMIADSSSWPFKEPVGPEVAPDYYEIIKEPIDLKTMQDSVNKGHYDTIEKFLEDVEKMFRNARTYNKKDTVYYKMADKLEASLKPFLDQLRDPSLR
jgi:histone acetyltransferase